MPLYEKQNKTHRTHRNDTDGNLGKGRRRNVAAVIDFPEDRRYAGKGIQTQRRGHLQCQPGIAQGCRGAFRTRMYRRTYLC